MNPPTLSIDFGASYTKVGFRSRCALHTAPSRFDETASLVGLDEAALIPTLAVQTTNDKRPWIFGSAAAELTPGPQMKVFQNWKAGLFNRDNSPDAAQASIIAHHYFTWLRQRIDTTDQVGLADCIVRVMVPAFYDFTELTGVLRRCFELAGWSPRELQFGTEPHANALGLLTQGRNVYTKGKQAEGIDFQTTYGANNPYIQSIRRQLLPGMDRQALRLAVVDIGAFTTDVAILTFDPLQPGLGDGLTEIAQLSFPLGTHESLDRPLWHGLSARHDVDFYKLSFRQRERIKFALFQGEIFAMAAGINLGDAADQALLNSLTQALAKNIWRDATKAMPPGDLATVFLSGGGARIPALVTALNQQGMKARAQPPTFAATTAIAKGAVLVRWNESGEPLERVATAVGGCSLIADQAVNDKPHIGARPLLMAQRVTEKGAIQCSCGGLNPDCGRCDGQGYLPSKKT